MAQNQAGDVSRETSFAETDLAEYFGQAWTAIERYADLLQAEGELLGLIGPREASRLWERHILNCASLSTLVPEGASVLDLGSGGGLPGLVLAAMRPDCAVELVEPMARRIEWLQRCAREMGLTSLAMTRARGEELLGQRSANVVTARAVAPLRRLIGWAVPLLAPGGVVLALKGERAAEEIEAASRELRRLRCEAELTTVDAPLGAGVARIVRVRRITST